jgi:GLPGLI family protein
MRKYLLTLLFWAQLIQFSVQAQTVLDQAKLSGIMEFTMDNDEGNVFMPDAEFNLFIKGNMSKVEMLSMMGNNVMIKDMSNNITTVLLEMMGKKYGYNISNDSIFSDTSQLLKNARVDSSYFLKQVNLIYTEYSKKINGIDCKKAIISYLNSSNTPENFEVWYCPDYLLPEGVSLGLENMMGQKSNLVLAGKIKEIKGLPVSYSIKVRVNARQLLNIRFEIEEIKMKIKIDDDTFEIPRSFNILSYREFQKVAPDFMK